MKTQQAMDNYYVLGMTLGHNATAALSNNGEIIACASEERFVRIKNVYGYPEKAVTFCLEYAKISPQQLDLVVLSSHITPPLKQTSEGLREESRKDAETITWFSILSHMRNKASRIKSFDTAGYTLVAPLLAKATHKKRVEIISSLLNIDPTKIISSEHHLTHAFSGIFASGWHNTLSLQEQILAITVDGEGDMLSSSVGIFSPATNHYERIAESSYAESVGHFYSAVTTHLGMKMLEHEYKVMGLAPYSSSDTAERIYQKLKQYIWIDDNLRIRTAVHSHHFEHICAQLFKGIRFDYVAAAAQKIVETLLVELVQKASRKTNISTVVLAGGVFMNVKANYEILKLPEIKRLFIMPSCGDESLPIGSCYYGTWLNKPDCLKIIKPLTTLYYGPSYSREDIEAALRESEFSYVYCGKKITQEIVRLLSKGEVVARCNGRMEFGARALGNRSILADASHPEVVDIINRMIKMRDFWMPFAPSILEEHTQKYVLHPELLTKIKPYFMMMAFESTPLAQKDLRAAMHPADKTIRPQLVTKELNSEYYAIVEAFRRKTGRAGILNTSFNIHGEPVVCSPQDALHTLRNSGLKFLALGDFIVKK